MTEIAARAPDSATPTIRPRTTFPKQRSYLSSTLKEIRHSARSRPATRTVATFVLALRGADIACLALGTALGSWWGGQRTAVLIGLLVLVATLVSTRYRWRFNLSVLDDLPAIAGIVGAATLAVVAAFSFLDLSGDPEIAVSHALQAGIAILATNVAGRLLVFTIIRALRRGGAGVARAAIIGGGKTGVQLGRVMDTNGRYGVRLLGFIDDDLRGVAESARYLGKLTQLRAVIHEHRIELVIVAFGGPQSDVVVDAIRDLGPARCEVYVVPRMYELHDRALESDMVQGVPLVRLRRPVFRSGSWRVKRTIDVLASALGLLLVAPVLGIVALAVRLETGRGIIYKQERVGLDGKPFILYKFRSLRPAEGEDRTRWNIDTDPRLGPVGRLIRCTCLDELPQLVNILRGNMSLVGPRPERPYFVDQFNASIPGYRHRHRVPVGLTGYAVVNGLRGDTSIQDRAHFDNLYAESWSLWLDVKIMLRTVLQILPRRSPRVGHRQDGR